MRSFNRKSFIAFLAAAMLVVSTVGFTTAYFSATSDAAGSARVALGSQTTIDEGTSETAKEIVIKNTGETDVIVRVAFYGPDKLVIENTDNWNKVGDWYYYKSVVPVGGNTGTPKLTAKLGDLSDKELAELGDSLQVTVVHESAPVVYKGSSIKVPEGWDASGVPAE